MHGERRAPRWGWEASLEPWSQFLPRGAVRASGAAPQCSRGPGGDHGEIQIPWQSFKTEHQKESSISRESCRTHARGAVHTQDTQGPGPLYADIRGVRRGERCPSTSNMAPTPALAINSMQYNPFLAGYLRAPVACWGAACSWRPCREWWAWAGRRLRAGRAPLATAASSPSTLL